MYNTLIDRKKPVVNCTCFKESENTLLLGVGNKYLSKTILTYQSNDLTNTMIVEFIKNIIKKQDGFVANQLSGVFKLCQFEGYSPQTGTI